MFPHSRKNKRGRIKLGGETRDKCVCLNFPNEVTGYIAKLKSGVRDTMQQTIKEIILFRL